MSNWQRRTRWINRAILVAIPVALVAGHLLMSGAFADNGVTPTLGSSESTQLASAKQVASGEELGRPILSAMIVLAQHDRISTATQLAVFDRIAAAREDRRSLRMEIEPAEVNAAQDGLVVLTVYRNPFRDPVSEAAALSATAVVVQQWIDALTGVSVASSQVERRELMRTLAELRDATERAANPGPMQDKIAAISARISAIDNGVAATELLPEIVNGFADGNALVGEMTNESEEGDTPEDGGEEDSEGAE